MDKIIDKKIENEREIWEELDTLIQEHKMQRLLENNITKKKQIEKEIKSLEIERNEVEKTLEGLYKKKETLGNTLPPIKIKEDNSEEDFNDELVKALYLLKQKKNSVEDQHNPSKKERQEIRKIESEIAKLMDEKISDPKSSTRAIMTDLGLFFEEIVFSGKKLDSNSIKEIDKIRHDKLSKNSEVNRAVIVSALSLRIINSKKIISKDWNLLIDFLTDFEDDIWERALTGLVLAFQYHQNKMGRFKPIMTRLEELQNTPKVQKGLTKIDSVLLHKTYQSGFFSEKRYTTPFFTNDPVNYFIPFYDEDNPIIEDALDKDNQGNIDHNDLIEELKALPYTNAQRYSLIQALGGEGLRKITLKGEEARAIHEIFYISDVLAPFQNIIQEYYCFTKYFPKNRAQNLFEKQQSISKTKLKDVILAEKERIYLSARAAYKDKKYATAIQYAKNGIDLDNSDSRMLKILADSWFEKKEYMNAVLYLKMYLSINSKNPNYWNKTGYAYTKLKEYEKALKNFKKAKSLNPEEPSYWFNIGNVYTELKEYEKALENYEKAKSLNPEEPNYWFNSGRSYDELKEYKKALENYEKAIKLDPKEPAYWNNLGSSHDELKEYKKALENYEKAINLDPKDSIYWNNKGNTYTKLKEYEKALENFKKAINLDPKNPTFWGNVGVAYTKLKEYKKALENFKKAKDLDPKNPDYWISIGSRYIQLKNYKEGIKHIEKTITLLLEEIKITPENVNKKEDLGWAYSLAKEYEKSREIINEALAMKKQWRSLGIMGHIELQKGNIDRAIELYQEAMDLNGDIEYFKMVYNDDIEIVEGLGLDVTTYLYIREKLFS